MMYGYNTTSLASHEPCAQTLGFATPPASPDSEDYTVAPEGDANDPLAFLPCDRHVWEDKLPPFMHKLEAGTLVPMDGTAHCRIRRGPPPRLLLPNGEQMISSLTGKSMRQLDFLPDSISHAVSSWRLLYWERKAAELGLDMTLWDIADRMQAPLTKDKTTGQLVAAGPLSDHAARHLKNALSMKLQRYRAQMGYLPLFTKDTHPLAFKQNIESIDNLYIMQGMLNTVWLPTHMLLRGPWKVVQPARHPGYQSTTNFYTAYTGTNVWIDKLPGLSQRVKDISDTIIFLDCFIQEKWGEEPSRASRDRMLKELQSGMGLDSVRALFDKWRAG
jgi:hypothetical protein